MPGPRAARPPPVRVAPPSDRAAVAMAGLSAALMAACVLGCTGEHDGERPRGDLNGTAPGTISAVVVAGCAALGLTGLAAGLCVARGLCGTTRPGLPS